MSNVSDYADRSCPLCFGKGEVRVSGKWTVWALCMCVGRSTHRAVHARALRGARIQRIAGE